MSGFACDANSISDDQLDNRVNDDGAPIIVVHFSEMTPIDICLVGGILLRTLSADFHVEEKNIFLGPGLTNIA